MLIEVFLSFFYLLFNVLAQTCIHRCIVLKSKRWKTERLFMKETVAIVKAGICGGCDACAISTLEIS
jgi:hypothetical protein